MTLLVGLVNTWWALFRRGFQLWRCHVHTCHTTPASSHPLTLAFGGVSCPRCFSPLSFAKAIPVRFLGLCHWYTAMFVSWLARSSRSHRAAVCAHPAARWRPLWLPALTLFIRQVTATPKDSGVCLAPPPMYPVHETMPQLSLTWSKWTWVTAVPYAFAGNSS